MCLEVDAMQFSPPPLISPVFTLPSNHPQNATVGCLPIDHPSPTQGSHPTYDPSLTQGLSHSQTIELSLLQNECLELREHTSSLESDVKRLKTQNVSLREERDRMKRRVGEKYRYNFRGMARNFNGNPNVSSSKMNENMHCYTKNMGIMA